MKKIKRLHKNFDYRHIICAVITLGFIALTVFLFRQSIIRIIESCRDFALSIAYYFVELLEIPHGIVPTVNELPKNPQVPTVFLPETWEQFSERFSEYWELWADGENFNNYITWLALTLSNISQILLLIIPLFIALYFWIKRIFEKQNNDYNVDTKPLKIYKNLVKHVYTPIKKWLISFISFVKAHKAYYISWLIIWAINFNAITIVIEFFAFYFYFVISFDFLNLYKQIYKLILDLAVPLTFIPLIVWIILALIVVRKLSKKRALKKLLHMERMNRGFINERPITVMVCGSMGTGKTTMLVDMSLSVEDMFRDKAQEKMLNQEMKFPNFPWINLENVLRIAINKHIVYNLATARSFIDYLKTYYELARKNPKYKTAINRRIRKKFKFIGNNALFDYDYEKYGYYFDDKLKVTSIWDSIKTYSQLYFIYTIQGSLMLGNFSIRTDSVLQTIQNFPLWDSDFFTRDSAVIDEISHHAHILDFDSLRLGRKVLENNEFADSFEFGVIPITEIGKERQNTVELSGKKKTDEETNQKNDLFDYTLKMIRHSATVDNYPFVKFLTDEQRPESWGANARDLCDIIHIRERTEDKLALPFFEFEELLHAWLFGKYTGLHYQYRFNRADNSLAMYLLKGIISKLHNHYERTYNQFGYSILRVQTERGTQDGELTDHKYFLINKKIYSKRNSTDCFSDFFTQKALRSPVGLNDIPEYKTEKADYNELTQQNSYFIRDIDKHFNIV